MMDEVRNKLQFWYYIQWRILHLQKSRVKTMIKHYLIRASHKKPLLKITQEWKN
jgi:hypothetical protein